jgi:hypothetical protein
LLGDSTDNQADDEQTLVATQSNEANNASDGDSEVIKVKHERDEFHSCRECPESHEAIVKTEPSSHDSFMSIKEEIVTERQVIKHDDDDDDIDGPTKKKRRTKQEADSNVQLYGYPPEGTMIPWGITRMRKQPKIFPVPERKPYVALSHALAAERRNERRKSDIPRLAFGEEETRLKEYGVVLNVYD